MKIGIYTIHTPYNYGAVFQAYATQKALEKMGYNSELVNLYTYEEEKNNETKILSLNLKVFLKFIYARINPKIHLKYKRFRDFHNHLNLSKRYYSVEEIYESPPVYDVHLVGSDQVWNIENGIPEKSIFFLDFICQKKNKISYASSFGSSKIGTEYYHKLNYLLSSFKSISVREDDGVNIIKKATGLQTIQVMDPTFLLDKEEWSKLDSNKSLIKGEYIFCYGFDGSDISKKMICSIRQRLNLPIVAVSVSIIFPIKVDHFIQDAGPLEFINLVKNAKFICTASYHGIAFAIHFRKSFFSTIHPSRNSRMECMLKKIGLENRQLDNPQEILQLPDEALYIDYTPIEIKIETAIANSRSWLRSTLSNI